MDRLRRWLIALILLSLLAIVIAEGVTRFGATPTRESRRAVTERDQARAEMVRHLDADHRATQARLVQVWESRGPDPRVGQAQGPRAETVSVHVKNGSQQLIRGLVISWQKGAAR